MTQKTDRLVDSKKLMETYGITSPQTLIRWTKRSENPLPKPIAGGSGCGNTYKWRRSQLEQWEIAQYGCILEM
ncbi:MAG: hypothetical protein CSA79_01075 [Thiothrix nivea]|nr:MAG: hypothetical protein CSA79_01075 [Thiothrix nivea]